MGNFRNQEEIHEVMTIETDQNPEAEKSQKIAKDWKPGVHPICTLKLLGTSRSLSTLQHLHNGLLTPRHQQHKMAPNHRGVQRRNCKKLKNCDDCDDFLLKGGSINCAYCACPAGIHA